MASTADINSDDYYKVLGVQKQVSDADLAKAYKRLALKHHPDKNPDRKEQAEEEFKRLTEAYDVLRDPEKRKIYDQCGKAGVNGGNPPSGEPNFSFNAASGPRQATMSREEADKIFMTFFGGSDPFASMFGDGDGIGSPFLFQASGPSRRMGMFQGTSSTGHGFDDMFLGGAFPRAASAAGHRSGRAGGQRSNTRTRSRRAQSRPQNRSERHVLPQGMPVTIQGLVKSTEHNGKIGHVVDWDGVKARYQVRLQASEQRCADDGQLWLRAQNITQLCSVEITGLASKPQLNGRSGEIFNYDESKHRYMVLVEDSALSLQPANCILSPGTPVIINGLSRSDCNGHRACVVDIDRTAGRYTVECENGRQIKIKYENVLC